MCDFLHLRAFLLIYYLFLDIKFMVLPELKLSSQLIVFCVKRFVCFFVFYNSGCINFYFWSLSVNGLEGVSNWGHGGWVLLMGRVGGEHW